MRSHRSAGSALVEPRSRLPSSDTGGAPDLAECVLLAPHLPHTLCELYGTDSERLQMAECDPGRQTMTVFASSACWTVLPGTASIKRRLPPMLAASVR